MAQNLMYGEIHQIPVVGLLCILQIHGYGLVTLLDGIGIVFQSFGGQLLKLCHKNQEATESYLMPLVHQ